MRELKLWYTLDTLKQISWKEDMIIGIKERLDNLSLMDQPNTDKVSWHARDYFKFDTVRLLKPEIEYSCQSD